MRLTIHIISSFFLRLKLHKVYTKYYPLIERTEITECRLADRESIIASVSNIFLFQYMLLVANMIVHVYFVFYVLSFISVRFISMLLVFTSNILLDSVAYIFPLFLSYLDISFWIHVTYLGT